MPEDQGQTPNSQPGQTPPEDPKGQAPTQSTPPPDEKGQEPTTFDRAYVEKLRGEAAGYRTRAQAAEAKVQEFEQESLSEQEKAQKRAEAAEAKAADAERLLARYEVAAEKGIPARLAGRLQGSTREELEQDADALAKDFGITEGNGSPPSFDQGVRGGAPAQGEDMNNLIRRAAGRPG